MFSSHIHLKHIILVASMILIPHHAVGQILRGRIIDKSGFPKENVIIINKTKPSADYTDSDGRFNIRAKFGDSLLISYYGAEMEYSYTEEIYDIVFTAERDLRLKLNPQLRIDNKIINEINTLYLSDRYKECIAYCLYLMNYYHFYISPHEKHSFRDWDKKNTIFQRTDPLNVATLCYLGAISAYQFFQYNETDVTIVNAIEWAITCVALYDDYFKQVLPSADWSTQEMYDYILYSEWGKQAAEVGQFLLRSLDYDRLVKKDKQWFIKKYNQISSSIYHNTLNAEKMYSSAPIITYKLRTLENSYNYEKKGNKYLKEYISNYLMYTIDYIQATGVSNKTNNADMEIHKAISTLSSYLGQSVIDQQLCKLIGKDFERFCMEEMIKLQDISYYLNGAANYVLSPQYSLRDIQDRLEDGDCAMIHFEGPVSPGHLYAQYSLGTVYRNYALLITRDVDRPYLWHRGFISNDKVNDLSTIKESLPGIHRFFYVGTPRMSFIDIAGNDSSIVRLHSLSQLLEDSIEDEVEKEVTFIGDLNYRKVGSLNLISDSKGGDNFNRLLGPATELKHIQSLFHNVRSFCGDDATRNIVASEISRNKGIVHISTHGYTDYDPDDVISPEDLVLKKVIMDKSLLILSGYNDSPHSSLSSISGSDVLKMRSINASIVFLDACESGQGAVGVSGPVGIAEAFHLIGADNVICYLEPIDDAIATSFSNSFYTELSNGLSCHDAFFKARQSINQEIKVVLWE